MRSTLAPVPRLPFLTPGTVPTLHALETDSKAARHTIKALVLAFGTLVPCEPGGAQARQLFQAALDNVAPLVRLSSCFHTAAMWDRMIRLLSHHLHLVCPPTSLSSGKRVGLALASLKGQNGKECWRPAPFFQLPWPPITDCNRR